MESFYSKEQWSQWLGQLAANEYVIVENFLPKSTLEAVLHFFITQEKENTLSASKVGPAQNENRMSDIRNDFTHWIDRERDLSLAPFFHLIDELTSEIAQELFLSLNGFEFHIAKYEKGGFYKAHLDQFNSRSNRKISLVIYLNENWLEGDGGELLVHSENPLKVEPLLNRAILFRSDTVLHEVLPSKKIRKSLTGWLLKQPSSIGVLGM